MSTMWAESAVSQRQLLLRWRSLTHQATHITIHGQAVLLVKWAVGGDGLHAKWALGLAWLLGRRAAAYFVAVDIA